MKKIHYAANGEWGSTRVNCARYYTTDVKHTEKEENVTCKFCKNTLTTITTKKPPLVLDN